MLTVLLWIGIAIASVYVLGVFISICILLMLVDSYSWEVISIVVYASIIWPLFAVEYLESWLWLNSARKKRKAHKTILDF